MVPEQFESAMRFHGAGCVVKTYDEPGIQTIYRFVDNSGSTRFTIGWKNNGVWSWCPGCVPHKEREFDGVPATTTKNIVEETIVLNTGIDGYIN